MTPATSDAQVVAGDRPHSKRRQNADVESLLLRLAARGVKFELRACGWMETTDSCGVELLASGRDLVSLAESSCR